MFGALAWKQKCYPSGFLSAAGKRQTVGTSHQSRLVVRRESGQGDIEGGVQSACRSDDRDPFASTGQDPSDRQLLHQAIRCERPKPVQLRDKIHAGGCGGQEEQWVRRGHAGLRSLAADARLPKYSATSRCRAGLSLFHCQAPALSAVMSLVGSKSCCFRICSRVS